MAVNTWAGYKRATQDSKLRMIGLSDGEVGSGKTRFWLTGPSPILIQSLDKGTEGVIEGILRDMPKKEIYIREYDWNPGSDDFNQDYAIELRDRIIADHAHGLQHARTILWDKETDIWEVFRYAQFGGPSDAPKDYAKLNQQYLHLVNSAKETDVSFGLIQSMKDEWGMSTKADGRKSLGQTGRRVRTGFSRLDELVMMELRHTRVKGEFGLMVGKCRQNHTMQDQDYPGMTFAEFGTLLVDGTTEADWS